MITALITWIALQAILTVVAVILITVRLARIEHQRRMASAGLYE